MRGSGDEDVSDKSRSWWQKKKERREKNLFQCQTGN
jgi:hypothetical protein